MPATSPATPKRPRPRPPPTSRPSVVANVLKWTLLALVTSAALSRALTETWLWGYEGRWSNERKIRDALFPPTPLVLSEAQLALHDGSQPDKYPLYLAVDGDVYDISDGGMRNYGPGKPYSVFAGRDAIRAFATGCFESHLTHDLRGLTRAQLDTVKHWKRFYANH
ncbi:heme/steroid binding domain protein, partial [Rhodotorula diobovata]